MKSKDSNAPSPSVQTLEAEISTSTSDLATVPSTPPFDPLHLPNVEGTSGTTVITLLTLANLPLTLNVATYTVRTAVISGHTGLSVRASSHQKARDDLIHILSVALLTNSPPLVKASVRRLS